MSPNLSLLTSRSAVEEAISECDALTRDVFLKKYGFKRSRLYPLVLGSRIYDSKAIVAVAFGRQHGIPLKSSEFSGGVATVMPVLERLGFSVQEPVHPATALIVGRTYSRKELLERYGGQMQGGIWTPKEFPVVFLFSGESGKAFGYEDGWTEDGVFEYTGEGQTGPMTFRAGNKAIRDHRESSKDLLLFAALKKGKGVRFEGLFECASWRYVPGIDKNQDAREIIVFDLVPVNTAAAFIKDVAVAVPESTPGPLESIEVLRAAAYEAANPSAAPARTGDAKRIWYERSDKVRNYVFARAKGVCEACDLEAPFLKRDGTPYLEPHHTTRLADEGLDHPSSVGAICPTCHRRIHSGNDGKEWNRQLQVRVRNKEAYADQKFK
jgi:5-methylcytosine-specific restriction protein A